MAFHNLKKRWHEFRDAEPGERFRKQYERRHQAGGSSAMRVLRLLFALVITLLGLFLMPAPGPGMVVVALGLSMLAHESLRVARALDAVEVWARPWARKALAVWKRCPPWLKALLILIALALGAVAAWLAWRLMTS